MNINNRKKLLALMMAFSLMVGCTVGGSLAWLMAKTDSVENTFVAGNITISLREHAVDPVTGKINPEWAGTEKEFTDSGNTNVKLLPGREIDKDPTVIIGAGSEPCYVRMYMIVTYSDIADGEYGPKEADNWFDFNGGKTDGDGYWLPGESLLDGLNDVPLGFIYEFKYDQVVDASKGEVELPPLFTKIMIPSYLTGDKFGSLTGCTVTVVAQAVQATGFDVLKADETIDVQASMLEAFKVAGRPTSVENDYLITYLPYVGEENMEGGKIKYPSSIVVTTPVKIPDDNSGQEPEGGE